MPLESLPTATEVDAPQFGGAQTVTSTDGRPLGWDAVRRGGAKKLPRWGLQAPRLGRSTAPAAP
jgi:hypothetical protein